MTRRCYRTFSLRNLSGLCVSAVFWLFLSSNQSGTVAIDRERRIVWSDAISLQIQRRDAEFAEVAQRRKIAWAASRRFCGSC